MIICDFISRYVNKLELHFQVPAIAVCTSWMQQKHCTLKWALKNTVKLWYFWIFYCDSFRSPNIFDRRWLRDVSTGSVEISLLSFYVGFQNMDGLWWFDAEKKNICFSNMRFIQTNKLFGISMYIPYVCSFQIQDTDSGTLSRPVILVDGDSATGLLIPKYPQYIG